MDLLTLSFDPAFASSSEFLNSTGNPSTFTSAFSLLSRTASNSSLKSTSSANSATSSASSLQRAASLAQKCAQLDISRISNRILVCSRCYAEPKVRQNDPLQLAAFLNGRFHDSYLLWNCGTPESLSASSSAIFGSKLIPTTLPRTQHPTLRQLFHLCHSFLGWLQLNRENVVIIQCTDGITRSGLVVACLLRFCGAFGSTFEALDYFCARRQVPTSADPRHNPSIRRLLRYFNDTCVLSGRVPQPLPLSLHQIIVNSVPNFDGEGGCAAGVEIFVQNALICTQEAFIQDAHHVAFKFDALPVEALSGDLQFHLFHTQERTRQRCTIAYFSLNTAFTQAGIVRFCAAEMEIPFWDSLAPVTKFADATRPGTRRFNELFSVDLIFLACPSSTSACTYESTVLSNSAKNLIRLSQFHPGRPDRSLLESLTLQGWERVLGKVALQVHGNDIHGAHEMLAAVQCREEIERQLREYERAKSGAVEAVEAVEESVEKQTIEPVEKDTSEQIVEPIETVESVESIEPVDLVEAVESVESITEPVESIESITEPIAATNHSLLEDMLKAKLSLRQSSPRLPSQAPSPKPDDQQQDSAEADIDTNRNLASNAISSSASSTVNYTFDPSSIANAAPQQIPMPPPPPPPMPMPTQNAQIPIAPPPPRLRIKNSLHWRELKNIPSIDQTVWSELSSPGRSCFSKAEFEELFCVNPSAQISRKASIVKEESAASTDLPLIVDVRRANNVGIGLARFNKRFESISALLEAIKSDPEAFSFDDYCALAAILPTEEESAALKLIKPADGLLERMGRAELFMYEVCTKHTQLPSLLQLRQFQCSAPLDISALKQKLTCITAALKHIKDSAELKLILKAALELGNLANYEYGRLKASFQAGVQAFTLDSLCHLHEVKSVDGSSNLLLFLVQSLLPEHPEICVVAEGEAWRELDAIKSWNGAFLLAELEALKAECTRFLSLTQETAESAALFEISTQLAALQPIADDFVATWQSTRSYFGEDPRDPPLIFEDVSVFIGTCAEFSKNLSVAIKQQTAIKRSSSN